MNLRASLLPACLLTAPLAWSSVAAQEYSVEETRRYTDAYAQCVVKSSPAKASEAILANATNRTIMRKYKMLIIPDCVVSATPAGGEMQFGGDLYRYALADALVRRELAGRPAPDVSGVAQLEHPEMPERPTEFKKSGKKLGEKAYAAAMKDYAEDLGFAFLSRYGDCVVRADPAGAKALLAAEPTSTAEKAGFDAFRPTLRACLPEGQTLEFGRTALRGTIAINYYRLAHAARGNATKAAQ